MIKVITHDGKFHPDEIFACVLLTYFKQERIKFLRTRNERTLKKSREDKSVYVIDVGAVYDENMNNFDHHQASFTERGETGELLSSCGLIWRHLKDNVNLSDEIKEKITEFTIKVDMHDNGVKFFEPSEFISLYNFSSHSNRFLSAFKVAKVYFENSMNLWKHLEEVGKLEDKALAAAENQIIFSEDKLSVNEKINGSGNLLLVVKRADEEYSITSVNQSTEVDFSVRCPAPAEWAGLSGREIEAFDKSLVFSHKNRFLTVVKGTKEDAMRIANIIIDTHKREKRRVAEEFLETMRKN